jgi:hypothetical protein
VVKTLEPLAASPAQAPEEPKAAAPENRGMNSSLRPAEPPRRKRVELTRVDEPMNRGGFPDKR